MADTRHAHSGRKYAGFYVDNEVEVSQDGVHVRFKGEEWVPVEWLNQDVFEVVGPIPGSDLGHGTLFGSFREELNNFAPVVGWRVLTLVPTTPGLGAEELVGGVKCTVDGVDGLTFTIPAIGTPTVISTLKGSRRRFIPWSPLLGNRWTIVACNLDNNTQKITGTVGPRLADPHVLGSPLITGHEDETVNAMFTVDMRGTPSIKLILFTPDLPDVSQSDLLAELAGIAADQSGENVTLARQVLQLRHELDAVKKRDPLPPGELIELVQDALLNDSGFLNRLADAIEQLYEPAGSGDNGGSDDDNDDADETETVSTFRSRRR